MLWTYLTEDLKSEEIVETFCEKELQKTNQTQFRIKKVTKVNGDKLYMNWKSYDRLFNSWLDKKDKV